VSSNALDSLLPSIELVLPMPDLAQRLLCDMEFRRRQTGAPRSARSKQEQDDVRPPRLTNGKPLITRDTLAWHSHTFVLRRRCIGCYFRLLPLAALLDRATIEAN